MRRTSTGEHYAFLLAILLGSFLLFLVQPMAARMALPLVGGSPTAWSSAMLVYQALLLAGYVYGHYVSKLPKAPQAIIHIGLLLAAGTWLPMTMRVPTGAQAFGPEIWLPWTLLSSIGPVFLMVASQAPLLQRWYAQVAPGRDPYTLYAASNLGSLAGLASYPLLVEPVMGLKAQSILWSAGYAILVLATSASVLRLPARTHHDREEAPSARRVVRWMALAAVPSGLMISTTTHLTTDIIAVPMLWVLPLAIYLTSFILAFSGNRIPAEIARRTAPFAIAVLGGLSLTQSMQSPFVIVSLGLALLLVASTALHGMLHEERPKASQLTGFYMAISAGGAMGGLFCAIIAPYAFDWIYEHPILILAAAALMPSTRRRIPQSAMAAWTLVLIDLAIQVNAPDIDAPGPFRLVCEIGIATGIALCSLIAIGNRAGYVLSILALMTVAGGADKIRGSMKGTRERSYFGVYETKDVREAPYRLLMHGTTLHGAQRTDGIDRYKPTTYYTPTSGLSRALANATSVYGSQARITMVGLGAGTSACLARPEQRWTFIEIDPKVVHIARRDFDFLAHCTPKARIETADARMALSRTHEADMDVLAIDAFSSDAIPMHLLTREAFATYARVLPKDGTLLLHITNRHLDLEPLVLALAAGGGWQARIYRDRNTDRKTLATESDWAILTRSRDVMMRMTAGTGKNQGWARLSERRGYAGWTDDSGSILPLIKW